MRKLPIFSVVLSFFLLIPASITWAQVTKTLNGTVRYESGMSETKFSTPNGDVVMKLPQSLSGPVITGTVIAEPAGNSEKEKSRNLKDLLKFVVKLDGQQIPLSATAQNFDWRTHPERHQRTAVELLNASGAKVGELSLPPVLTAPSPMGGWQSDNGPRLATPSKLLVKGDMLNVYTNRQFNPGEKFVVTDSKGQQFTVRPSALSANQAVITVPPAAATGILSIREEAQNNANSAKVNLIDISLSSPNTNLKPGERSFVMLKADVPSWQGPLPDVWFGEASIDLRNLDPNTVTMEGGNLQRVNVNHSRKTLVSGEQTVIWFQLKRNITGIKPGNFSVSASLHDDYSSSDDPFRPQLNVLKTPEDFNEWVNALKKDLKEYATMHDNDLLGQATKTNAQRAIDNMPVCSDPGQLDECKAVAYSLVQPLRVPKGAAVNWYSSFIAARTAAKAIDNTLPGKTELVDYDVIRNGVEYAKRVTGSDVYPVQQLINIIQHTTETKENVQDLENKLHTLTAKVDARRGSNSEPLLKYRMEDMLASSYAVANPSRNFGDGFMYEISFPVMDAADRNKSPMINLKVTPEPITYGTDKIKTQTPVQSKQKTWAVSNFNMTVGDLPSNNVSKIDLPSFTAKVATEHKEMSGIKILIPASDSKPWQDWYNNYQKGGNKELKSGSVEYADQNGKPLFTLSLDKVKPVSIQAEAGGNYSVTLQSNDAYLYFNPLPGFQFNTYIGHYVANEIAGNPCNPEGATTISWLYIEKPCRVEMATTRASNIDPDAEDILNDIQDLLGEVSEDGADLGAKLAKTFSITKSFAVWIRVVRDWESYKAEYICRNGVWQHGEMTLANSGIKEISGWQLFRGESGNDTWAEGDDMGWIMRQAQQLIASVCGD